MEKYPADVIRYYMTLIMPETKDSDFKRHEFMERNNELVNTLGNLVNRTLAFSIKNFDGKLSLFQANNLEQEDKDILEAFANIQTQYIQFLDSYKFKEALNIVFDYLRQLNKYFNDRAPWVLAKSNKKEAEKVMSITSLGILKASLLFSVFMPHSAKKIFQ
ncbi:MAG: class I tRNA ligase family protein [bacterium]|nr:class I tRNA ligase family protein [bacterium]